MNLLEGKLLEGASTGGYCLLIPSRSNILPLLISYLADHPKPSGTFPIPFPSHCVFVGAATATIDVCTRLRSEKLPA